MFNPFRKQENKDVEVAVATPSPKAQTINEIIEEIHESFYTEVDKLLAEAKISRSLETDKQDLLDKCKRLEALGFTSTKEVMDARHEIQRLRELQDENATKESLVKAINYFSFKYPTYKFITEKSVEKICEKYNLVYGPISKYIGTVPDKNLKHIEDFKVLENDECYVNQCIYYSPFGSQKEILGYMNLSRVKEIEEANGKRGLYPRIQMGYMESFDKMPLEIAAPIKDFNMEGMEVKERKLSKIEIPDPVVLKPVVFDGKKHYLIVTAWGIEASDELVVNHINN
jgi:hypothetical protein